MAKQFSIQKLLFAGLILLFSGIPLLIEPSAYLRINEEPYFYLFGLCSLLYLSVSFFINREKLSFSFNHADIFIIVFFTYAVLRSIFLAPNKIPHNNFLNIGILAAFYIVFKQSNKNNPERNHNFFISIILLAGYVELISSYLQWLKIMPNIFPGYRFGGTFGNPGPFAIYLASVFVILFDHMMKHNNRIMTFKNVLILLFLALSLVIIGFSKSRASWIALAAGSGIVLIFRTGLWDKFRSIHLLKKISVGGGCTLIILFLFIALLAFKQDSARGRLFIWKNTLNIIREHPLTGVGYYNYHYYYNHYQSRAFQEGKYSEKEYFLADSISMAFNDYLQITAEFGIIGLLLFLAAIFYTAKYVLEMFKTKAYSHVGIFACLFAILSASMFSYSLTIIRFQVLFVLCLAMISGRSNRSVFSVYLLHRTGKLSMAAFAILCLAMMTYSTVNYARLRKWNSAGQMYSSGRKQEALLIYHDLYNHYKNFFFLYNYSTVLKSNGAYFEAINVLTETGKHLNTYNYYLELGQCHLSIGNIGRAEDAFMKALSIIPSRILPRYYLFHCALRENNPGKAIERANDVLYCKVKVNNTTVKNIRKSVGKYLEDKTD